MTRWISLFFIFTLVLGIVVMPVAQDEEEPKTPKERAWPSEITVADQEIMFAKLQEKLNQMKEKKEKISVALVDGKFIRGTVTRVSNKKCGLLDYQNNLQVFSFTKMKAKYWAKLLPPEAITSRISYNLGILFYYEKEWKIAEMHFQKAAEKGINEAEDWIKKIQDQQHILLADNEKKDELDKEQKEKKEEVEKKKKEEKEAKEKEAKEKKIDASKYPKTIELRGNKKIEVSKYLVPQRYTLFQFHAEWCGPCKRISPMVNEFVQKNEALYLRKVDIISWGTASTKQFDIKSIPFFILYGPDGSEMKRGGGELLQVFATLSLPKK